MNWMRRVGRDFLEAEPAILVLRMTCLFLLFRGFTDGGGDFYSVLIAVICMAMLLSQRLLTTGVLWIGMAVLLGDQLLGMVATADNHKYLITYWVLACGLCAGRENREALLSWNGRVLIGAAFAFATIWKVVEMQYWDGAFFHFKLLVDPRFQPVAEVMAGMGGQALETNVFLSHAFRLMPGDDVSVRFLTSDGVRTLALVLSYWTLIVEFAIAIWFLGSRFMPWPRARHWLLIVFCLSAYVVAPVDRFATLLSLMGIAQCGVRDRAERLAFAGLFLLSFLIPVLAARIQDS